MERYVCVVLVFERVVFERVAFERFGDRALWCSSAYLFSPSLTHSTPSYHLHDRSNTGTHPVMNTDDTAAFELTPDGASELNRVMSVLYVETLT